MKAIGKIVALAMTLSLAFVLSACGGSASSSASSSSASASASSASAAASSASASASAASASAASESASAASAAASDEAANAYDNEFFGLKFDLPEGWSFIDASKLKDVNSVLAAASENATIDMVATNAAQDQIVIVDLVKASDATAGKTAEQYLEAQSEQMKNSLTNGNYTFTSESATVTFDGIDRELPAIVSTLTVEGQTLVIVETVAEKDGNFIEAIAMGKTQDEVVATFKNFKATTE